MSAPVPPHTLSEDPHTRGIALGGWTITSETRPIAAAGVLDGLHAATALPPPEMTFAHNGLRLRHAPSGWAYAFAAPEALAQVVSGALAPADGPVQVKHAKAWQASRPGVEAAVVPTKPYDWTYTTLYAGHTEAPTSPPREWAPADPANPAHTIPLAELTRPDPILFYAEVPLFESELDDNGASTLLVRIRVMPTCIFVLARFCLRVDHVLFRVRDTRLYHSFASDPPLVIRETGGWEAPYDLVKSKLPRRDDLSPLTDPMFVGRVLATLPVEISQGTGAGTGWKGLGTTTEVLVLE